MLLKTSDIRQAGRDEWAGNNSSTQETGAQWKAFSDPWVSKQTKNTSHCALLAGCTPGVALSGSRWLPQKAASGWKRVNWAPHPRNQGYSTESAEILLGGGEQRRREDVSTQNSSAPLEGRPCKEGSLPVLLNPMLTTGEMKEYITKRLS